jgi:hypothetical protein
VINDGTHPVTDISRRTWAVLALASLLGWALIGWGLHGLFG